MSELLVIIPSRGRPEFVADLIEAWRLTAEGGLADLLICLDYDDETKDTYREILRDVDFAMYDLADRNGFAPRLSAEAMFFADSYRMLASWGDDHRPRTIGWDREIVNELNRLGSGFVYPNDLVQREALPTACAMTSDVVTTLGWMVPPGLQHLYIDNVWLTLGMKWKRITYLPDVIVEHVHPITGKVDWDDLYRDANSDAAYEADRSRYETWEKTIMVEDLWKLRQLCDRG